MKKKILSVLCSLAILAGMLPATLATAAKAEAVDTQKAELLTAIGVMEKADEQALTVEKFLKMMSNLYQQGDIDPVSFGIDMQMIEENEDVSEKLTVAKAVKLAVITLGYRPVAEGYGGNANAYAKVAYDLEIADGLSPTSEKAISFAQAVELMYAMLEAVPMVQKYDLNNAPVFEVKNNETILSLHREIFTIKGTVTANDITSIYKADGCRENSVEIDMVAYENVNGIDFQDMLGKEVEAYITDTETGTAVLYMIPEKYTETIIDAENIVNADEGFEYIEYRNADGTSKKRVKLDYPPKVIYNGRFYSDYTTDDLEPALGHLRLLDSDTNGKYDIVFVDSYQEMVVEARAMTDKLITNKLTYEGALASIELEGTTDRIYTIMKDGKEATYGQLNIDDVLLVAESKDGRVVAIYASGTKAEGELRSYDTDEMELSVDGTIYPMTDALIAQLAADKKTVEFGTKYRYYINAEGSVTYMEEVQELNYYLYFKNYLDENDNSIAMIVYLDMNNQWHTSPTAKKVAYLDDKCEGDVLNTHLEGKKPQIVKMDFNSKGEVKGIEFATDTDLYKEDVFTRSSSTKGWYYAAQRTIDYRIFAYSDAQVLVMPTTENAMDKTQYKWYPIGQQFYNDKSYTVRAYDLDEYMFSHVFSTEKTTDNLTSGLSSEFFLVKNISSALVDDEVGVRITGNLGKFVNYELETKDSTLVAGVKKGDLIRYHLDEQGYLDCCQKVISLDPNNFTETWNILNGSARLVSGTLTDIDISGGRIKFTSGGSERTLILTGTSSVMIYEAASGETTTGSFLELKLGDKIVINGNWHTIAAMYCVR